MNHEYNLRMKESPIAICDLSDRVADLVDSSFLNSGIIRIGQTTNINILAFLGFFDDPCGAREVI